MGKEAKIGLGIILILLIVFGVVLARRLNGPSDESAAAPGAKAKTAGKGQNDSAGKNAGDRTTPTGSATRPTVIEAKAGSGTSAGQSSPADIGQWSVVSDGSESKQAAAGAGTRSAPPSFMPNRPATDPSSPQYNPYRIAQPAGKTAGAWQGGQATAAGQDNSGQYPDPFQRQSGQAATGDYRDGYGQGYRSPSGYAPAGQLNPARQTDAYNASDPAAPAAANPLRGQTGKTAPPGQGSTGSRYSTGNYGATGYGPTSYRAGSYGSGNTGQYSQAGAAQQGTPSYAAGAGSTYQATPQPPQTAAQYGTAATGAPAGGFATQYSPGYDRREDGTYVVQPNDSYWVISERLYGSGAYFKALAEHNREKYPEEDKLKVGDVISAPTKAELAQTYADLCPKQSHVEAAKRQAMAVSTPSAYSTGKAYVVQEGDTLFDIARWELGKAARWSEIYDLNRDILGEDFDHLTPGVKLTMPSDDPADTVTRRNGSYYQR